MAEAACRAERGEQAMLALKLLAHNRQSLSATNKERCKRARRSNGSLRAEGRAARHGLAAALRGRTNSDRKASEPLHEGRILHLPNVGIERLPEAVRSNDGLDAPMAKGARCLNRRQRERSEEQRYRETASCAARERRVPSDSQPMRRHGTNRPRRSEQKQPTNALMRLTFDMSGWPKGAKRPLARPLDGRVRPHSQGFASASRRHRRSACKKKRTSRTIASKQTTHRNASPTAPLGLAACSHSNMPSATACAKTMTAKTVAPTMPIARRLRETRRCGSRSNIERRCMDTRLQLAVRWMADVGGCGV